MLLSVQLAYPLLFLLYSPLNQGLKPGALRLEDIKHN